MSMHRDTQRLLEETAKGQEELLKALGFERVSTTVAGIESGSTWAHPEGFRAEMKVRNMNVASIFGQDGERISGAGLAQFMMDHHTDFRADRGN